MKKRTKEWKEWKKFLKDTEEAKDKIIEKHNLKEPKTATGEEAHKILREHIETIGLGDVVESITKATGIKKVVDAIAKKLDKDCGCGERKTFLNKLPVFRKTRVLRCLNEEQVQDYKIFIEERKKGTWTIPQQQLLIDLYAQAFALQYNLKDLSGNCSGCAKVLQNIQDKLDSVYNER